MKKKPATKKRAPKQKAPLTLDPSGVRIWEKWCDEISDFELLENYCIAYQTMIAATTVVRSEGILVETPSGIKKNPACDVQATAQRTMITCSRKLGLETGDGEIDELEALR